MTTPTEEQRDARRKFHRRGSLKINALAGSGKTTTLKLIAKSEKNRQGHYLAFNRAIADEAAATFPSSVTCKTTHALAWRTIKEKYSFSPRKLNNSMKPRQLASVLKLNAQDYGDDSDLFLNGVQRAFLASRTVTKFCHSDAEEITTAHVPDYGRLKFEPKEVKARVEADVVELAKHLWTRMTQPFDEVYLGHDGYLKLWILQHPILPTDYILVDEAQDTNPAVLGMLRRQPAQLVFVGDRFQQIYEWRGAINAMSKVTTDYDAHLTQSFRFGDTIASEASEVIASLGATQPLRGNPATLSTINGIQAPNVVLSRTNFMVINSVIEALNRGQRPFVVGGVQHLLNLVSDVYRLQKGEPAETPELFGFSDWLQVVAFSETEEGQDLRTFVHLVEHHGKAKLWAVLNQTHKDEVTADIFLSTAHKAKGREWSSVELTDDFLSDQLEESLEAAEAEARLFYVAITRAQQNLIVNPDILAMYTSASWRRVFDTPHAA